MASRSQAAMSALYGALFEAPVEGDVYRRSTADYETPGYICAHVQLKGSNRFRRKLHIKSVFINDNVQYQGVGQNLGSPCQGNFFQEPLVSSFHDPGLYFCGWQPAAAQVGQAVAVLLVVPRMAEIHFKGFESGRRGRRLAGAAYQLRAQIVYPHE